MKRVLATMVWLVFGVQAAQAQDAEHRWPRDTSERFD